MNIEQADHFEYVLRLGDNALILGQRLSEWCGHSPFVEEDVAMANTALDHVGRARMLLTHAGSIEGKGQSEDDLAYKRYERDFKNFLIAELPIGDFAFSMVRQLLLDTYHYYLFDGLTGSADETLAAIAAKAVKESRYHLRRSSQWLCKLGDGTDESHAKTQDAVSRIWRFTSELFEYDSVDHNAMKAGLAPDMSEIERAWRTYVADILAEATLQQPEAAPLAASGREGRHTEHLGFLLAEMQYLQRAYPGQSW
ncbi:MAG: 1,2-phenylacetyl-CoA epoxidase subunit PaaC [Gammaproteobacteria bacterium]